MKKLIASALVLSFLSVGGMTPYAETSYVQQASKSTTACTYTTCINNGECIYPDCPNGGTPALDGTGYQSNRNQNISTTTPNTIVAETAANADKTLCPSGGTCVNNGECTYPDCPNGGTPALDGTGYQSNRNQNISTTTPDTIVAETAANADKTLCPGGGTCVNNGECTYPDCPNGGTPALDGTGHHGGAKQENSKNSGTHSQNGKGHSNGTGHGNGRNR